MNPAGLARPKPPSTGVLQARAEDVNLFLRSVQKSKVHLTEVVLAEFREGPRGASPIVTAKDESTESVRTARSCLLGTPPTSLDEAAPPREAPNPRRAAPRRSSGNPGPSTAEWYGNCGQKW